ncbi:hypothetical protein EIP86_010944 [Pleurotus ostreatoroseus]|nr:hypothetical protein EIP86_010944 [Pleurotus ostreatoroseus]
MSNSDKPASPKSRLSYLTRIAHTSAPFISTFLLIHLSAPIMANLGGGELASQVMILGREYYGTPLGHKFLVVLPIVAHTGSAIAKRFLQPPAARRPANGFTTTGYLALLFFIPVHYAVHHILPSDPAPPIEALAPAELNFEYVKYGLQRWPVRSWFLYVGLTACVAWHAAEGMQIIWNTWMRGRFGGWKSNVAKRSATVAAVLAPVLSGLFVLSKEPVIAFMSSIPRFEASFLKNFIYRI